MTDFLEGFLFGYFIGLAVGAWLQYIAPLFGRKWKP